MPLTFILGKETYTLSAETLARMRQAMDKTTTRERGFALLGDIRNLIPGEEQVGDIEGMRVDVSGTKGFFHTHPDGNPELSPNDWVHTIIASGELSFPFLQCSGARRDVYCTTVDDIDKLRVPKRLTDEALDELVQHLVKPYHFKLERGEEMSRMTKREPLYPHVPKSRGPKPSSLPSLEDLQVKFVEKMSEELRARDEYYELAKTADLVGRPDIALELRRIGDIEHVHSRKFDEMERRLRG